MTESEVTDGQTDIFQGGNEVLLQAIAHPEQFEAQCGSVEDVKRAFSQRGFSTEGSGNMTMYGGRGKFGTGTPDCCFVLCGKELCAVKTSLSTRPEAQITRLCADANDVTPAEIGLIHNYQFLYGGATMGPKFEAFLRRLESRPRADDTLVTARVDETIHGTTGFRSVLGSIFRTNKKR